MDLNGFEWIWMVLNGFEWIWIGSDYLSEVYLAKDTTVYSHLLAWCFWQVSAVRWWQYDLDSHSVCFQHEEPESFSELSFKTSSNQMRMQHQWHQWNQWKHAWPTSRWFFAKARRALMASSLVWYHLLYLSVEDLCIFRFRCRPWSQKSQKSQLSTSLSFELCLTRPWHEILQLWSTWHSANLSQHWSIQHSKPHLSFWEARQQLLYWCRSQHIGSFDPRGMGDTDWWV